MNYFFHIFLFCIISINIKSKGTPIVISFESTNKKELKPEKYFFNLFNNELKINLKVGSHQQSIPCYLNLNIHTVYICGSDSELHNGQPKYEEYKSTTYTKVIYLVQYPQNPFM